MALAGFSELIRNFDKIRDYMRDFYIYGFKRRGDFGGKSARSYDNEKRRIESYLSEYMNWNYDASGKRTFVSVSSAQIAQNPLYAAWKAKSFTDSDIMLHFALLDILASGKAMHAMELTETASQLLEYTFDVQTVRGKCREYEAEGILQSEKQGRNLLYSLREGSLPRSLRDAATFFSEAAPLGEIGSFIMESEGLRNDYFRFKHHFIVHTLEDQVLLDLLQAMREKRWVQLTLFSRRNASEYDAGGVPLKILSSSATGRRYVCVHQNSRHTPYSTRRLDYIRRVILLDVDEDYDQKRQDMEALLPKVWGVAFGAQVGWLRMKLWIDEETEPYVLDRVQREGRGGSVERLEPDVFLYSIELLSVHEIMAWVKTFIGRILSMESSDAAVVSMFQRDMRRMGRMYLRDENMGEEGTNGTVS